MLYSTAGTRIEHCDAYFTDVNSGRHPPVVGPAIISSRQLTCFHAQSERSYVPLLKPLTCRIGIYSFRFIPSIILVVGMGRAIAWRY